MSSFVRTRHLLLVNTNNIITPQSSPSIRITPSNVVSFGTNFMAVSLVFRNWPNCKNERNCHEFSIKGDNNTAYIQNPSFPSAYSSQTALTYTINKCSSDVCSVRLDFETFTTRGPAGTEETDGGVCTDSFQVTGTSGQATPIICGMNRGQHSKCFNTVNTLGYTVQPTSVLTKTSVSYEIRLL